MQLAVLAVLAAAAGGWLAFRELGGGGRIHPLPWRDLTGSTGRLVLPEGVSRVFDSQPVFAAYLRARDAKRVPEVRFPSERALLVTTGPRSTTGYALKVARVFKQGGTVFVSIARVNASLSRPGKPRVTFPHVLIALPARGGEIHVRWLTD